MSCILATQTVCRVAALAFVFGAALAAANVPGLTLATFLGGSDIDGAGAVRIDARGNVYIAGTTSSVNFPVTANALQKSGPGTGCFGVGPSHLGEPPCRSLFVAKFAPDGALLYSTYLGTSSQQRLTAMAVDGNGAVYVLASYTDRRPDLLDLAHLNRFAATDANSDYVLKLNADGASLAYARLLPQFQGGPQSLAVDPTGSAYLTGFAYSGLPIVAGRRRSAQPAEARSSTASASR